MYSHGLNIFLSSQYLSLNFKVVTGVRADRMESFYIAETLKYLFLLFDPNHWLLQQTKATAEIMHVQGKGNCIFDQGGWIFNTEGTRLYIDRPQVS